MNTNSSMSENAKITIPKSTVRTVSLEKLRQPSPLTEQSHNTQNVSNNVSQPQDSKKLFQKLISRKTSTKLQEAQLKEKDKWNGKHAINKKFEGIRKEMDEKQMKECTFKPQINPSEKNIRTVHQFFHDQVNYDQKKNDKIEEMRILLENNKLKQATFRPNTIINRENQSHQNSTQVYDRLYQDSKNKDKKEGLSRQESSETFRNNSITKSKRFRGISRGNSSEKKIVFPKKECNPSLTSKQLHKESLQSDQMSSQLSAITTRKASTQLGAHTSRQLRKESKAKRLDVNILEKKDNSKNEQIYIGKLMKEMSIVLNKCNLPLVFSYMEMNFFLEKMNFLSNNSNSRRLVYEIWNTLQGELFKEVSALSVMKIIYAIMGCHNILIVNKCIYDYWLSNAEIVSSQEQELKKMGKQLTFKQNMLMLSERDSKTLRQTYEQLYLNRMKAGQSEFLKDDKATSYSFKPTISKASEQYAEKYRNRMLSETQKLLAENKIEYEVPENGQIDHVDLLMLDDKRKTALLQQKREEKEREQRRLEDQSLLNPGIHGRQSNKSSKNLLQQRDRNQELYQLGKNANQAKKDKSTDEIEEEKWKNELTFKPNLKSKQTILNQLNSKQIYIPDYEKSVYRMHEARKSKENSSRPSQQDDSPLLYLNVVMEGSQSTKVPVFKDDTMKSITEKVRVMMDFNELNDRGKLEKILKMQILPALKEMNLPSLVED